MKKIFLLLIVSILYIQPFAQTVTLSFSGCDMTNTHVRLNHVDIYNLTRGWMETVYWPDTVLTMQNSSGIEDDLEEKTGLLLQNIPNPFNGETVVMFSTWKSGEVSLSVYDMKGIQIVRFSDKLGKGLHVFKIRLSEAQTYLLQASCGNQVSSIKMINHRGFEHNEIEYVGDDGLLFFSLKSNTNNPFVLGDLMEYVGYATINDVEKESQHIHQIQNETQFFMLQFTEVQYQLPTLNTTSVSDVMDTSATSGGNVTSDGGAEVSHRGVCYSTNHNPTISDSHTTDGSGIGTFTSHLLGLSENTTYYVRAYATNSVGTAYGEEVYFTTHNTVHLPSVTTATVFDVAEFSATCGGEVTDDGGANVIARGICWDTTAIPDINGNHTNDGIGNGEFTSILTGLTAATQYYVRAYATNSEGTAYGDVICFSTANPNDGQSCTISTTVTDFDGNVYNTVQIGNQCWMRDNLRSMHFPNGQSISWGSPYHSYTNPYRYVPGGWSDNVPSYGFLYNWSAVMHGTNSSNNNPSGVQGICPNGWHVPSLAERIQMTDYVRSRNAFLCDNNSTYIAKALASTTGWDVGTNACAIGNNQSINNATGFSARPAGLYCYDNENGVYSELAFGRSAYFWLATEHSEYSAYNIFLNRNSTEVGAAGLYGDKCNGMSVRCVCDENGGIAASLPTVTVGTVSSVTTNFAICGGEVLYDGGTNVILRGVCYNTLQNPTVNDSHTVEGNGTGCFSSVITGLTPNTTYYVRSYATNSIGTAYGDEIVFTTVQEESAMQPCPEADSVVDYDGNIYQTVKIGDQCWMKENLRTTHFANGNIIPMGTSASATIAYRYVPNNNLNNVSTYGYLYNWAAVINGDSPSNSNPSGVQGICPNGWHVPSDSEWIQLLSCVGSQSPYLCSYDTVSVAKALASTMGWSSGTATCAVGNNVNSNNATNFEILPAGVYSGNNCVDFGNKASYWTATGGEENYYAYLYSLHYNGVGVTRYIFYGDYGFSVRCVKD